MINNNSHTKVLIITHEASMLQQFNLENIKILLGQGAEVHLAANFKSKKNTISAEKMKKFERNMTNIGVKIHQIDFERRLGTLKTNIRSWKQLDKVFGSNDFALVHCQSPLGGVFGRLMGHKYKVPVLYTCHGFHFYKGGPKIDWLMYYPIERILSKWTNTIVTINRDDYQISKRFKTAECKYIPGVGVDISKLKKVERDLSVRNRLGIPDDAFVLVSVGELSRNKNEEVIINALGELKNSNIYYVMVGKGKEETYLKQLTSSLDLNNNIKFVGYQQDPIPFYAMADASVFPSRREGLGLAGIEAIATGLPLITTNSGGISDYSTDDKTGYVVNDPDNYQKFSEVIQKLIDNPKIVQRMSVYNRNHVDDYSIKNVNTIMSEVYLKMLNNI